MRCRPITLLCIALLLAGCGSLADGDATPAEPTTDVSAETATTATNTPATTPATVTPTATPPDPSPTPDPAAYPPGVDPDGLQNLTALERASRASVVGSGFVATADRSLTTAVLTRGLTVRTAVGASGYPYRVRERETENGTLETETARWANQSIRLTRYRREHSVEYRHQEQPAPADTAAERIGLFDVLEDGEYDRVTVRGSPGDWRFVLTAATAAPDDDLPPEVNLTGYEGTVVVDGSGMVLRANVTVALEQSGDVNTFRTRYDLVETGSVAVERPGWVDARVERVLDTSARATAIDDRFVRVENTGRAPLPAGGEFVLWYDGCGRAEGRLETAFPAGETLYVYVSRAEGSDLGINRTAPSGPAEPIDDPYTLLVLPPGDGEDRPEPLVDTNVVVENATDPPSSTRAFPAVSSRTTRRPVVPTLRC